MLFVISQRACAARGEAANREDRGTRAHCERSRPINEKKKEKKNRKRETARSLAIDPKESCLSKFIDRCKHNYVLIGAKI